MEAAKVWANVFKRNDGVIAMQVAGLSHADSLLQPQPRGNCLNFVLGHIAEGRQIVLRFLGIEEIMSPEEQARYATESEPILADGEGILTLERLVEILGQSAELIAKHVEGLSEEELEQQVVFDGRAIPLWKRLEFYGWHDTYHVGQAEYLRQLAGTDDKVI